MRISKTTTLIKRNRLSAIARTHQHGMSHLLIMAAKKIDHLSSDSLSLIGRIDRQVFQLINTFFLIRYHSYGNPRFFIHIHHKQIAPIQITVDHRFLFVRQKKQREELFFIRCNLSYLPVHSSFKHSK